MLTYIIRRVASACLAYVAITAIVFSIIHLVPGDPSAIFLARAGGGVVPQETIAAYRHELRLDEPILMQYVHWIASTARLDFGRSILHRRDVSTVIAEKLPNTLVLNLAALVLSLGIALPFGSLLAARRGRALDRIVNPLLMLSYSLPSFWIALLLIDLFAVKWQLLPLYGMTSENVASPIGDRLAHMVLPVIVLAYGELAMFTRFTRAAVIDTISRDFVRTARAKGATRTRALLHALRVAAVPLVTAAGMSIPYLLSGSLVVERVFEWDGMGRLFYGAVVARDYPLVMGLTVLTAWVTLAAYLLTDLLYVWADPRITLEAVKR